MNMRTYIALAISTIISLSATAHSPTEIGIKLIHQEDHVFLEVHLTSSTLFDILGEQIPELKGAESINLSLYQETYLNYFNDQLDVHFNERHNKLSYVSSHLLGHDAHIKYLVENVDPLQIEAYSLEVNAFQFYQNPKFTILYDLPQIHEMYQLNKKNNRCIGTVFSKEASSSWPVISSETWFFIMLLMIGSIAWFTNYKLRTIPVSHPE